MGLWILKETGSVFLIPLRVLFLHMSLLLLPEGTVCHYQWDVCVHLLHVLQKNKGRLPQEIKLSEILKKAYVQTAGSNGGLLKKMANITNGTKYMRSIKKSVYLELISNKMIAKSATAGGTRHLW